MKHSTPMVKAPVTSMSKSYARYCVAIVILCFAVYANSLTGGFVWDDTVQVVKNPNIRQIADVPMAFTTGVWSFMASPTTTDPYYRPVQTVFFTIAYRLGGLTPFP